jgi:arylsulfatase A-like enzyme
VPLILRLPGRIAAGSAAGRIVGLADVAPTVTALCGLAADARVQGASLLGDGPADARRRLFAISAYPERQYGWAPLRALRSERLKYVEAPRPELYDLAADPGELRNLAPASPRRAARVARAPARGRAVARRARGTRRRRPRPTPRRGERLAALGTRVAVPAAPDAAPGRPEGRVARSA